MNAKTNLGAVTAYAIAVKYGYTGTEEEWAKQFENIGEYTEESIREIVAKGNETLAAIQKKAEDSLKLLPGDVAQIATDISQLSESIPVITEYTSDNNGYKFESGVTVPAHSEKFKMLSIRMKKGYAYKCTILFSEPVPQKSYFYAMNGDTSILSGTSRVIQQGDTEFEDMLTANDNYENIDYVITASGGAKIKVIKVEFDGAVADHGKFIESATPLVEGMTYEKVETLNEADTKIVPNWETGKIDGTDGHELPDSSWIRSDYVKCEEGLNVSVPNGLTLYVNYFNYENGTYVFKLRRQYTDEHIVYVEGWYDFIRISSARTSGKISLEDARLIDIKKYLALKSPLNFTPSMQEVILDVNHGTLEEEYDATRKSFADCYKNGRVGYIFATDFHVNYDTSEQGLLYQKNQLKIICDLANSNDIDFVCLGGDYTWGSDSFTKEENNKYLRLVTDGMKSCNKPVIMLRGNHDNNKNSGQTETDAVSDVELYGMTQAIFRRPEFVYDEADPYGLYFYFDIPHKKTRVICYDYMENHGSNQIKWLVEKALTKHDGWHYIILSHVAFDTKYNPSGMSWIAEHGTYVKNIITTLNTHSTYTFTASGYYHKCDYSESTSTVDVVSIGHAHVGYVGYDSTTRAFITVSPAASSNTSGSLANVTADDAIAGDRRNRSVYDPVKYVFDLISVTHDSVSRVRFGSGVDKTVNR